MRVAVLLTPGEIDILVQALGYLNAWGSAEAELYRRLRALDAELNEDEG